MRGTFSQDNVRELSENTVEWDKLLAEARTSGVSSLLYYILETAGVDGLLPRQVMSGLQVACYSVAARNIHYYRELSTVLSSFQRLGIQVIILKGAALAKTLYPDISLRPFVDIDLLIRDQDLAKVERELQFLGYSMSFLEGEFHQGYVRRFDKHLLYSKGGPITVNIEIHTSLLPFICMQRLEADGFWERGVVVSPIFENSGLVLSTEDMLLHLCIHIFNHNISTRLLWLYDVALMILKHGESINWKLLEKRTRMLGVHRIVGLVLDHVGQTFDIPMPQNLVPWLELSRLGSTEKYFFANGLGLAIWRYSLRLRQIKGVKNKLEFVLGKLFPSRDYFMRKYSVPDTKFTFFSYYYYFCHAFLDDVRSVLALVFKRDDMK